MPLQDVYARQVTVASGGDPVQLVAASAERDWTEIELLTGGPVYIGGPDIDERNGFRLTARDPRPFPTGLAFWARVDSSDYDAVVQVIGG